MRITSNGRKVTIYTSSADEAMEGLTKLIKGGIVNPNDYNQVAIDYDGSSSNNSRSSKAYPVKFKGKNKDLWLKGFTAGYNGNGPHSTVQLLELMGFKARRTVRGKILGMYGKQGEAVSLILQK